MDVTVLFYELNDLELKVRVFKVPKPSNPHARVVVSHLVPHGSNIVAVLEGSVNVISRTGERMLKLVS